jgi:hypothetical protein
MLDFRALYGFYQPGRKAGALLVLACYHRPLCRIPRCQLVRMPPLPIPNLLWSGVPSSWWRPSRHHGLGATSVHIGWTPDDCTKMPPLGVVFPSRTTNDAKVVVNSTGIAACVVSWALCREPQAMLMSWYTSSMPRAIRAGTRHNDRLTTHKDDCDGRRPCRQMCREMQLQALDKEQTDTDSLRW